MPSGLLPSYGFKPTGSGLPNLRTCSSRRARLFAGGTYFRARDPGLQGNLLQGSVVQLDDPADGTGEGFFVLTNQNLKYSENITGADVDVRILALKAEPTDLWIIDDLDTAPVAHYYSISLRIRFAIQNGDPYVLPDPLQVKPFQFGTLFSSGKLSVFLEKNTAGFTPGQKLFVMQRAHLYPLLTVSKTPPLDETGAQPPDVFGFSIEDLRSKVQADEWIEMLERSGPSTDAGGIVTPNPNPVDLQDPGTDSLFLTPFDTTSFGNGDGLPASPNLESTGPSRSLVHVNYGELPNGALAEMNTVYEWVGDSSTAGSWKKY